MTDHDLDAPDLEPVVKRLRAERPRLSALELDAVSQRVRARAAAPARRRTERSTTMKSRIAMLALLVFGVMLSGTGAGLAIQGSTGNGNAAQEQYPTDTPAGGVLGEQEDQDGAGERGNGDAVAGAEDTAAPQVERQVAAGTSSGAAGGELPFTGFAAIPILLLGLAMTVAGVVLRRRSAGEDA